MKTKLCALAAVWLGLAAPATAQHLPLPADGRMVNVKAAPYNAAGNGTTDDTQAIQAAITFALNNSNRYGAPRFVYFPRGTYRVSNTLLSRVGTGGFSDGWRAGMVLVGESEAGSVIRLADNAPGYQDPAAPKAVIRTGSEDPNASGGGNQAFRHSVLNLTVHTGSGNPGAQGLDYIASNRGAIEHVTVRSGDGAGVAGIAMVRNWPGPSIVKHVRVEGFDYGVLFGHYDYGVTLEYLALQGQRRAGVRNANNVLHIRKLLSQNTVPAVEAEVGNGQIVLLDADLRGGATGQAAIVNNGFLLVRNATSTGYGKLVENNAGTRIDVTASSATEFSSHVVKNLFPGPAATLNLPVEETPEYDNADLGQWASVAAYGATPDNGSNDDAPGIQAAIDAGRPVVYLPNGDYAVSAPIIIRGHVRRFTGLSAQITRRADFPAGQPLIRFENGAAASVTLEHLRLGGVVEHNANRALALRHLDHDGYRNTAAGAAGKLFVEDVIGKPYLITGPQRVWARQLNAEFGTNPLIENNGGTLWLLGLKTEGEMTCIKTVGGTTELLGALTYPLSQNVSQPAFVSEESRVSLSFTKAGPYHYPVYVRETRGSVTRDFTVANLGARCLPLFTGYGSAGPLPNVAPTAAPAVYAYPNPFGRQLTVEVPVPAAGPARLRLRDALGRVHLTANYAATPGLNRWPLGSGRLAPGLYVLEVELNGATRRQQLVKE